jgi:hypothetical protein
MEMCVCMRILDISKHLYAASEKSVQSYYCTYMETQTAIVSNDGEIPFFLFYHCSSVPQL